MKNVFKVLAIFAIVAVVGFSFASCKDVVSDDSDSIIPPLDLSGFSFTPALNGTPVTSVPDNDYCTGTIAWKQSVNGISWTALNTQRFTADVRYQAVVELTVKPGFTFTGVKNEDITYAGYTVVVSENTGDRLTVFVTFPPIASPGTKTVTVGIQNGILIEGIQGSVSFPVTTANISNGTYTPTVANLPAGVTVSPIVINGNSGTLTLTGDATTTARTVSTLTLIIDGAQSAAFTLTINAAGTKVVQVGDQSVAMITGAVGSVSFLVTTANITNGTYTPTVANLPAGVSVSPITINGNSGTLTLTGDVTTVA